MSRHGNCHDNAVAESFFQQLKRERIKRRIYIDREEAKWDVFDYIEMFYNPRSSWVQWSPVSIRVRETAFQEARECLVNQGRLKPRPDSQDRSFRGDETCQ
jgi:putative transposase